MNLHVKLGPAVIRLMADREPMDWPHLFISRFACDPTSTPDLTIQVTFGAPAGSWDAAQRPLAEFAKQWRLYDRAGGQRLEILEQESFQIKQIVHLDAAWDRADLYILPITYQMTGGRPPGTWYVGDLFEPFVQWWLTSWLAKHARGIVLHSAIVAVNDHSWVFFGPSEAGKTTTARFFHESGYTVFNDERTVIWRENGRWMAAGSPWNGELRQVCDQTAPLSHLFSLKKALSYQLLPLSKTIVLSRLMGECYLPLWSQETLGGFLDTAECLIREVPCEELHFLKDRGVVDFLVTTVVGDRPLQPA